MSVSCQQETHAPQQKNSYRITSSPERAERLRRVACRCSDRRRAAPPTTCPARMPDVSIGPRKSSKEARGHSWLPTDQESKLIDGIETAQTTADRPRLSLNPRYPMIIDNLT